MLARHGEPALSRRVRLSAEGYRRWWAAYEEGGILQGQTPPAGLVALAADAGLVVSSGRRRAVETAAAVMGGRPFARDVLFVEAPLPPPPLPEGIRLSPKTWGFLSRVAWWFFGHSEGGETRREAEARARDAATRLVQASEGGRDVLLIAHGFFNAMVERELRRLGWRSTAGRGYKYWATHRFERPERSPGSGR